MASKTKAQTRSPQDLHKALSNATQAEIWTILSERKASPAELARELGVQIHTADYHVGCLVDLGYAEEIDSRPVRGATEHFYRATEAHFVSTEDWEALPAAARKSEVGQYMQAQIDAFTKSAGAGLVGRNRHFHMTCTPHLYDPIGRDKAMQIVERARKELVKVDDESAERLRKSGEPGLPFSSAHALFEMPEPK